MARIETLLSIARQAGHEPPPLPVATRKRASASAPYDAGGQGTRMLSWQASRLGPTTLLWGNLDQIRSRARDAVRNNPWAASAIDKFESNVIGSGIQPHWQHKDEQIRLKLQKAWNRWCRQADYGGQSDFYGLQALLAREIFEAGEIFIRYRIRPSKDGLFVPLQLQLIEGEQVPVWRNVLPGANGGNMVRAGIEFDGEYRRVAYHMYREHPGETMFFALDALSWISVPASEIRHVFKPLRVGQLRGQPHLTAVLALLYELDQYSDAELVRKKVSAMFAGFIKKAAPEVDVMPPAPSYATAPGTQDPINPAYTPQQDPGTDVAKLEPGTLQQLLEGEDIVFPDVPDSGDFSNFVSAQLHKFAAGVGMTYEQVTMDLRGVNYSSIRAGLLEFRRACEQLQFHVIVHQACEPIKNRWLREAVLCGAVDLPSDYFEDPTPYEECIWVPPGWQWIDPLKENQAAQADVRAGFTSRSRVVRERGEDPSVIDAEQAEERARAARLGITYDSDPNKVLIGRETQPETPTTAKPTPGAEEEEQNAAALAARDIHRPPASRRPQ